MPNWWDEIYQQKPHGSTNTDIWGQSMVGGPQPPQQQPYQAPMFGDAQQKPFQVPGAVSLGGPSSGRRTPSSNAIFAQSNPPAPATAVRGGPSSGRRTPSSNAIFGQQHQVDPRGRTMELMNEFKQQQQPQYTPGARGIFPPQPEQPMRGDNQIGQAFSIWDAISGRMPQQQVDPYEVAQRAGQYARPYEPYFDVAQRQLEQNTRNIFNMGGRNRGGALNQQVLGALTSDAENRRRMLADIYGQAQSMGREDVFNRLGTQENRLGQALGSGQNMMQFLGNIGLQQQGQDLANWQAQTGLQKGYYDVNLGAAMDRLRQQNQLGYDYWRPQYDAYTRGQEMAGQRAHEESLANQALRQQIGTGIFAPAISGLLRRFIDPAGYQREQQMQDFFMQYLPQMMNAGGA